MVNNIHHTAIIDNGAKIGEQTLIWHWTHVCSKSVIGDNSSLGQNVYVANNVTIGNNCKIQNNVSLYEGVIFEDYVFCGPSVVFTNVINPRSGVDRKSEFKKTIVRLGSSLGANATILCGAVIGNYSFVAAGAVVTKNTKAYGLYAGVPARQIGWISKEGFKLNLPLKGNEKTFCKGSEEYYFIKDETCYCEGD